MDNDILKFIDHDNDDGDWKYPKKREKKRGACEHKAVTFDTELRTIECNYCGAMLDAFECIVDVWKHEKEMERKFNMLKELERRMALRDTIKKQSCKHTRARMDSCDHYYCPSCSLRFKPGEMEDHP